MQITLGIIIGVMTLYTVPTLRNTNDTTSNIKTTHWWVQYRIELCQFYTKMQHQHELFDRDAPPLHAPQAAPYIYPRPYRRELFDDHPLQIVQPRASQHGEPHEVGRVEPLVEPEQLTPHVNSSLFGIVSQRLGVTRAELVPRMMRRRYSLQHLPIGGRAGGRRRMKSIPGTLYQGHEFCRHIKKFDTMP